RRAFRIVRDRRARSRRSPQTARTPSAWGPRWTTVRPVAVLSLSVCPPREHQGSPPRAFLLTTVHRWGSPGMARQATMVPNYIPNLLIRARLAAAVLG